MSPQLGNEKLELLFLVLMLINIDAFDTDPEPLGEVFPLPLGAPALTPHCAHHIDFPLHAPEPLPLPQVAMMGPSNLQIPQSLPRSL